MTPAIDIKIILNRKKQTHKTENLRYWKWIKNITVEQTRLNLHMYFIMLSFRSEIVFFGYRRLSSCFMLLCQSVPCQMGNIFSTGNLKRTSNWVWAMLTNRAWRYWILFVCLWRLFSKTLFSHNTEDVEI